MNSVLCQHICRLGELNFFLLNKVCIPKNYTKSPSRLFYVFLIVNLRVQFPRFRVCFFSQHFLTKKTSSYRYVDHKTSNNLPFFSYRTVFFQPLEIYFRRKIKNRFVCHLNFEEFFSHFSLKHIALGKKCGECKVYLAIEARFVRLYVGKISLLCL